MAGRMHTQLAFALMELPSCFEEAQDELVAAADAEAWAGHLRGQATAVESLGLLRLRQWRFADAFDSFQEAGRLLDGIGPADAGFADLPRARALLGRHRGRALRGLGRFEQARQRLDGALVFFRDPATAEPYNEARVLTDLAETERDTGEYAAALRLIDQAVPLLSRQNAAGHLAYLDVVRRQCLSEQS
jgi:tetratricopeptide (TPR) repeat protein